MHFQIGSVAFAAMIWASGCLIGQSRGEEGLDWPQFRGPNAQGFVEGANVPAEFGPDKNLKWKIPVGAGLSCPTVANGQIYLTTFTDGKLATECFSLGTGKQLWRQVAPAEKIEAYHHSEGSPAASTVATDGKHVVSYFGSAGLFCYSPEGTQLWQHPLPMALTDNDFGTGVSPIIADGLVILQRDLQKESQLLALDVNTGKLVWSKPRTPYTSFGTPMVWQRGTEPAELIVAGTLALDSYRLKDGEKLWTVQKMPAVACTTPVTDGEFLYQGGWAPGEDFKIPDYDAILKEGDANHDGQLAKEESGKTFIANFFDNNDLDKDLILEREEWESMIAYLSKGINRLVAIKPGAQGDATESHVVWERKRGLPYVPSILCYQGRIHMVKDGGLVSCYDAKTGKVHYEQQRIKATGDYYASPVAAGDRIYLISLEGKLTTIKAADTLQELATVDLGERGSVSPAIAGKTMLVRTANTLWAFEE